MTQVEQISDLIRTHGLPPGSHLLRDVSVPVFVVNSESESLAHFSVRQPDTDSYRFWEFAGHAHGTVPSKETLRSSWERDLGMTTHPMAPEHGYNALSLEPGRSAALEHMLDWLEHGTPPPTQDRIRIEASPAHIVRDDRGNALGGIRMPSFAVPTARHTGFAPDGTLHLFGSTEPFDKPTLRALYPDHQAYTAALNTATAEAVDAGVLLPRQTSEQLLGEGGREPLLVTGRRPSPIDHEQPEHFRGHERVDDVGRVTRPQSLTQHAFSRQGAGELGFGRGHVGAGCRPAAVWRRRVVIRPRSSSTR